MFGGSLRLINISGKDKAPLRKVAVVQPGVDVELGDVVSAIEVSVNWRGKTTTRITLRRAT